MNYGVDWTYGFHSDHALVVLFCRGMIIFNRQFNKGLTRFGEVMTFFVCGAQLPEGWEGR